MGYFIVVISGLIVGSFLNAVIHRLHTGDSIIMDRSKCVNCGRALGGSDLIPVLSFVLLGGKCRYCKKPISWQYPLVELATACSFVLITQSLQFEFSNFELWFQLFFACIFIVIAVYDLKHYLILDKVIILGLTVALTHAFITDRLLSGLIAATIAAGFFGMQYLASSGRWIGLGDVKLGLLLGLVTGFPIILAVLFLAYMSGALAGVALILLNKKNLSSKLPFGTFLAVSAIIMLSFGEEFVLWYRGLIGL